MDVRLWLQAHYAYALYEKCLHNDHVALKTDSSSKA